METALGQAGVLIAECFEDLAGMNDLDALAESCRRAGALERVFARMVESLTLDVGPGGLVGPDHLGDGRPHPYVAQLALWQRQHAQLRKWALDVGVDQRRLELDEVQARQWTQDVLDIVDGYHGALIAAGVDQAVLDAVRRDALPGIVRRVVESGVIETTGTEGA